MMRGQKKTVQDRDGDRDMVCGDGVAIGTWSMGMEWGWGHGLRGWGGDEDMVCGDGMGMETVLWERVGDGDEQLLFIYILC